MLLPLGEWRRYLQMDDKLALVPVMLSGDKPLHGPMMTGVRNAKWRQNPQGIKVNGMVRNRQYNYNDVIMGAIASQIAILTIVYSTVYSGADQRKHQSSASLAFVRPQMANNVQNVSIWWRHRETFHRSNGDPGQGHI